MSDLKVAVRPKSQNAIVWLVEALEAFDHIVAATKDDPKLYSIVYKGLVEFSGVLKLSEGFGRHGLSTFDIQSAGF